MTRIGTLLVANRGEIALRVIRAARAMGLRTVAVYSDADQAAPHVRAADTAVRIGPAPAAASYLNAQAIIDAARATGADAIHPGYGFLSEQAAFARAVGAAGLVFVGPPPEVIELMGRKDAARQVALDAGVPVVPAAGPAADDTVADPAVGFPLLVKAAAGGGGKGMRIVRTPEELPAALQAARREAMSAFGDPTLLVERYVERGRHVEVQILADRYGNVVHLFERDCSAQRRHQKILEEAPAPTISAQVRAVLTDAALALAKKVGYVNAGTVEFLVSGDEVFFLEMNTRLQVEHPVTELVTGLDLVRLQLRIAAGEPLPFTQEQITLTGHAIEARVYAEDAFAGFLPQAGRAHLVRWPAGVRVDAALESGQEVTTFYDPMLGKVIVHGPDREAARQGLAAALGDTAILGLTTNVGFLRGLVASDAFRDGAVDTAWLDRNPDAIRPPDERVARVLAAWALAEAAADRPGHPFGIADGWRLGAEPAPVRVELAVPGRGEPVVLQVHRRSGRVDGDGMSRRVRPIARQAEVLSLEIDGVVHRGTVRIDPQAVQVAYLGHTFTFLRVQDAVVGEAQAAGDGTVPAPMPGTVLSVAVQVGQTVEAGAVLGVMEAMKMELPLTAPLSGTVTTVAVKAGDQVPLGAVLFTVEGT